LNYKDLSLTINQKRSVLLAINLWDYLSQFIYYNIGISEYVSIHSYFYNKEAYSSLKHHKYKDTRFNVEKYEPFLDKDLDKLGLSIETKIVIVKSDKFSIYSADTDYIFVKDIQKTIDTGVIYLNLMCECDIQNINLVKNEFIFLITKEIRHAERRIINNINVNYRSKIDDLDQKLYMLEAYYLINNKKVPEKFQIEDFEDFVKLTEYQKRILKKLNNVI